MLLAVAEREAARAGGAMLLTRCDAKLGLCIIDWPWRARQKADRRCTGALLWAARQRLICAATNNTARIATAQGPFSMKPATLFFASGQPYTCGRNCRSSRVASSSRQARASTRFDCNCIITRTRSAFKTEALSTQAFIPAPDIIFTGAGRRRRR